ncbi:MAG TPA: hypothetical protein VFZ31_05190 [Vicinamibacterales bacterium]
MVYFGESSSRRQQVMTVFRKLPALRLSLLQAARWFGLPQHDCEAVLLRLVAAGELRLAPDGRYELARTAA